MGEGKRVLGEGPKGRSFGALGLSERWSLRRKPELVLRLPRGGSVDAFSREPGLEM